LLDGHNRLDICQRLKLPYETVAVELASREHALLWIEENQLGRRNLTTDQRAAIALRVMRRKSDIAVREQRRVAGLAGGRGRPKSNSGSDASSDPLLPQAAATPQRLQAGEVVALKEDTPRPIVVASTPVEEKPVVTMRETAPAPSPTPTPPKRDSRAETARQAKVPERKIRAAAEIEKKDPEAIARIARGETTIIQERAKLNAAARAAVAEIKPVAPTGRYSCIVIDPPWPMEKIEREVRRRSPSAHRCGAGPRPGRRLPSLAGA
jgi:hypothetical protein